MKTSNRYIYFIIFVFFICLISGCATLGQAAGGLFSGVGYIIGGTLKLVGKVFDLIGKLPMPPPGVF